MANVRLLDYVKSLDNKKVIDGGDAVYVAGATTSEFSSGQDIRPADTVYVNSVADLPDPSSGVRQLENANYVFVNDISDSNQWAVPDQARCSFSSYRPGIKITSTSALPLIINNPAENFISVKVDIEIDGPGPATSGAKAVNLAGVGASKTPAAGTYSTLDLGNSVFSSFESSVDVTDCIITGSNPVFLDCINHITTNGSISLRGGEFENDAAGVYAGGDMITVIDGGITDQFVTISNARFTSRPIDFLFNIDSSFPTSGRFVLSGSTNVKLEPVFNPAGLDQKTDNIRVLDGLGFTVSRTLGEISLSASTIVPIAVIGQHEPVAGTSWITLPLTERFTSTTDGRLVYDSDTPAAVQIVCNSTVDKVGGGSDEIEFCPLINGTPNLTGCTRTQNGDPSSVTAIWTVNCVKGTEIRVGVANLSTTSDVTVLTGKLLLMKIVS